MKILEGNALDRLRELEGESIQCCVTSPPYWKQRDYGFKEQIGLESDPLDYVEKLSAVFAEVRRVLCQEGSLWLNISDKWATGGNGGGGSLAIKRRVWREQTYNHGKTLKGWRKAPLGYKNKDLVLTGFMVAERLRQDGWFLRKVIIWSKPSATEPPRLDRPSVSHEYLFLLSKANNSSVRDPGEDWWQSSVWKITPGAYKDHPAVMPCELVRRAIVSGSKPGDTVLDPFAGSGTTAVVAVKHGRDFVGVEINPDHISMTYDRILKEVLS